MNKHTPGPWNLIFGTEQHGQIKSAQYTIAKVDCRYGAIGEPEANTRLIAAAPELLEALEMFSNMEINTSVATFKEAQKKAREAIAKATGK